MSPLQISMEVMVYEKVTGLMYVVVVDVYSQHLLLARAISWINVTTKDTSTDGVKSISLSSKIYNNIKPYTFLINTGQTGLLKLHNTPLLMVLKVLFFHQ